MNHADKEDTVKVKELMTKNVETIPPRASLVDAATRFRDLDVGVLPVTDSADDRGWAGLVTDRDVCVRGLAEGLDPKATSVEKVMTREIVRIHEDADIDEASKLMSEHQIRRLVVVDADERPAGLLSLGDLAVATKDRKISGRTLEAISS